MTNFDKVRFVFERNGQQIEFAEDDIDSVVMDESGITIHPSKSANMGAVQEFSYDEHLRTEVKK